MLLSLPIVTTAQEIIYFDDFDSTELNNKVWSFQNGDGCPDLCGWGNNELQTYRPENLRIEDSNLIITTTRENNTYYSAKIQTKDKLEFQYGTIEVKAMLPSGTGIWPAIWLLGSNIDEVGWPQAGEIDMMEFAGKNPDQIHTTMHTADSHGNSKNTAVTKVNNLSDAYHIFKTVWNKEKIAFYIDDALVYTFNPEQRTSDIWPYDQPFYLILNTAVGGTFGGDQVDDTIFPQEFKIDYIKITQ